jgi:hypothetical protein
MPLCNQLKACFSQTRQMHQHLTNAMVEQTMV